MKRLILVFGLVFIMTGLIAQEKGQFVLQAEANAGVLFHDLLKDNRKVHPEIALGAVFGYQVSDHLSLGIGANVRQTSDVVTWLPVFASAKFRFDGGKVRPFVEARCGYAFCLLGLGYKGSSKGNSYVSSALCEGFYATATGGCSFGHSDLGLGVQFVNIHTYEMGWNIAGEPFTYESQNIKPAVFVRYAYRFYFGKQTSKIQ
jgi:hypothetical protein